MIRSKAGSAMASALLALGVASSANAFTITSGDFKFTIDNYDAGTTNYGNSDGIKCQNSIAGCDAVPGINKAPGSAGSVNTSADTFGIFSVSTISNISTGAVVFQKGGADGYLTGIFGNLADRTVQVGSCAGITGCATTALSAGGNFSLWKNVADYNPALGPQVVAGTKDLNAGLYPGISGGSLYLQGVFGGGVLAGDTTSTYLSTFNNLSIAGAGSGFLDLTGGSAFGLFNTNALTDLNGNKHDLFLDVTYNDVNNAASALGWSVTSAGQIKSTVALPEPGSLALVALGLIGAGAVSRRKTKV